MQTLTIQEHQSNEFNAFPIFNPHIDVNEKPGLLLLEQLQTSLEVESLLNIFAMEASKYVDFSGLYFKNQHITACIRGSRTTKVERTFELKIDNEFIGVMTYTLNSPISLSNYKIVAQLHKFLLYPLRNAVYYRMATQMAMQDSLTSLGNRRHFDKQLKRAMHHANRHQNLVGLILGDLDKFKTINDTHGHQVGDQVLSQVAKALEQSIRDSDSAFRFGGDEFAVIVEDAGSHSLKVIENRIKQAIDNDALLAKYRVSCSLGACFMNRADTEKSLFERTDQALYRRKMSTKLKLK